jgi:hypothetical protein
VVAVLTLPPDDLERQHRLDVAGHLPTSRFRNPLASWLHLLRARVAEAGLGLRNGGGGAAAARVQAAARVLDDC